MSDKMQGGVIAGATSVSMSFVLRSSTNSSEVTGKAAADMTLSYWRQGGTRTAVGASDLAAVSSAYASGGVKEVDSTNMPGAYRVDWPNAAFAAGADWVEFAVKVSGCFVFHERVPITSNVIQSGDAFAALASVLDVNVVDWKGAAAPAMTGDAYGALTGAQAEPGQGTPAVNASPLTKLAYLFKAFRNKVTQTATTYSLFADDAATVDHKATIGDDGTTFTKGELGSGP